MKTCFLGEAHEQTYLSLNTVTGMSIDPRLPDIPEKRINRHTLSSNTMTRIHHHSYRHFLLRNLDPEKHWGPMKFQRGSSKSLQQNCPVPMVASFNIFFYYDHYNFTSILLILWNNVGITCFLMQIVPPSQVAASLNKVLDNISKWDDVWKVTFEPNTCKATILSIKRNPFSPLL